MDNNYSFPSRDARFRELDMLIAEQNRHQGERKTDLLMLDEDERTRHQNERRARLKREAAERQRARRNLLVPGVRRV